MTINAANVKRTHLDTMPSPDVKSVTVTPTAPSTGPCLATSKMENATAKQESRVGLVTGVCQAITNIRSAWNVLAT